MVITGKTLLVMKLTAVLLFAACQQVNANGNANRKEGLKIANNLPAAPPIIVLCAILDKPLNNVPLTPNGKWIS
jgi:hypothetical protein